MLGNRLKYLQANLADETPENRQTFLEEELRRALQAVPSSKRGLYLDALAERFPSWELATVAVNTPAAITQRTPDEIVRDFLDLAPKMSGEQREDMKQKLAALGFIVTSNKPIDGDALTDVQAKLKLGPDDPIDPQRLGKLFAALADVMLTLDQLAWNLWRSAAPKSTIRRDTSQGDLRMLIRRSIGGDAEASAAQVQKQLEGHPAVDRRSARRPGACRQELLAPLPATLHPGTPFARRSKPRAVVAACSAISRPSAGKNTRNSRRRSPKRRLKATFRKPW
jgi:hypothetical protein